MHTAVFWWKINCWVQEGCLQSLCHQQNMKHVFDHKCSDKAKQCDCVADIIPLYKSCIITLCFFLDAWRGQVTARRDHQGPHAPAASHSVVNSRLTHKHTPPTVQEQTRSPANLCAALQQRREKPPSVCLLTRQRCGLIWMCCCMGDWVRSQTQLAVCAQYGDERKGKLRSHTCECFSICYVTESLATQQNLKTQEVLGTQTWWVCG